MEVALEPAPLGVPQLDDAHPRRTQRLDLIQHRRAQALVVERGQGRTAQLPLRVGTSSGEAVETSATS